MKERKMKMNKGILLLLISFCAVLNLSAQSFSNAPKKAQALLAEAESNAADFPISEAKIREAKAIDHNNSDISYNFGNLYLNNNELESARLRLIEAIESSEDKSLKHKSYHNLGNAFMEEEQYQLAVDAYKDALRNDPTDEETRYNLAYAKSKLEKENNDDNQDGDENKDDNSEDENKDQSKDNKDEGENDDKEKDNKDQNKDDEKGDQDENKDDQKDKDGNKDEQEKEGEGGDDKKEQSQQQPQNREGKISPEQIQSLLEAIENQEKDVQEKLNAQKAKGQKSKTGKDW